MFVNILTYTIACLSTRIHLRLRDYMHSFMQTYMYLCAGHTIIGDNVSMTCCFVAPASLVGCVVSFLVSILEVSYFRAPSIGHTSLHFHCSSAVWRLPNSFPEIRGHRKFCFFFCSLSRDVALARDANSHVRPFIIHWQLSAFIFFSCGFLWLGFCGSRLNLCDGLGLCGSDFLEDRTGRQSTAGQNQTGHEQSKTAMQ